MKTLLALAFSILLTATLVFAGPIETNQAKLQEIQAEWTFLNGLKANIEQRQQVLNFMAKEIQIEIKKLVAAQKAAAVKDEVPVK